MKRKFLENLGLEKEVIDKIMDEQGKEITTLTAQRDNYKEQYETAQTALKEFEGVDVKELQTKISTLNTQLSNKDAEWQGKLDDMEFNGLLKDAVKAAGARNEKTIMALLDVDTLKSSKNRQADITAALECVKKENGYLFQGSNTPYVVSHTEGPKNMADQKEQANAAFRSLFGKE